ncbi:MFS transporter [Paenibacillus sp. OK003]|uniref:MFS transporter n=1 Tax=Paenibacillus sp. OK003 TaxID=1884380 RepID=UPI0008B46C30|nr:MFS transporter [Paenibacillus sp. OK003]SEK65779.1 Predicted arabinose efflux permease, MFS family [Paenibacillus sp. OK003]
MLKRSYYGLLATVTLSSFGDVFGLLAMEWLVYEITASKMAMGAMALSFSIPEVAIRLLGSPLADRLHRGRFMAVLASVRLLALLLPLSLGLAGDLQLWHLFLAAGLSGACSALFMPTAMAIIPGVSDEHKLVRSFAVIDGCRNAAALLGPALAGALTAVAGALPTLGINAVCYTAAIVTLLYLPAMQKPVAAKSSLSIKAYFRDIHEGFSFYRSFPAMLSIMGMVSISNMSSVAIWTMMIPFVREVLNRDAAAMGTLTTASACGTLIGLLVISWMGEIKRRRTVMLCSLAAIGLFNALLGLFPSYPFALVALCAAGAAGPFFGSLSSALHGTLVPGALQGRVNSIRFLIGGGLQPVGAFAGAAVAELYGLPFLFLSLGLLPLLCSVAASFLPNLKNLDGDLSTLRNRTQLSSYNKDIKTL